ARIALRPPARTYLGVEEEPGQQVASLCEFLCGPKVARGLAQKACKQLTRLGQEVAGTDGVSQADIHRGLIIEQASGQEGRASVEQAATLYSQRLQRAL